jgi:hypothetical protein
MESFAGQARKETAMDTITITGTTADDPKKKVKKNASVKWKTNVAVSSSQQLKVVLDSYYGSNVGTGGLGDKYVDLTLSLTSASGHPDVNVFYSLILVETMGVYSETTLIDGSISGPYLVIDDIGKPPGGVCEEDEDHLCEEGDQLIPHREHTAPETERYVSGGAQG